MQEILPPEQSIKKPKGFFERFGAWLDKVTGGFLGGMAGVFGFIIVIALPATYIAMLIHLAETTQWAWFVISLIFPPGGLLAMILWIFGVV